MLTIKALPSPTVYIGPMQWGWVELSELTEIVNRMFERYVARTNTEIWRAYFRLSKDAGMCVGEGVLAAWDGCEEVMSQNSGVDFAPSADWDHWMVPAGWAKDVIIQAQQGVWNVTVREVLGSALTSWLQRTGHTVRGEQLGILPDVQVSIF